MRFVQLAGRVTGRIGAEPVASPAAVPDGGVLLLGASRLRVGRDVAPAAGSARAHGDAGGSVAPDVAPDAAAPTALGPATDRRAGGGGHGRRSRAPSACSPRRRPCSGRSGIAVVMGSPMFLLFGAVGVLASVGMWLAGRIGAARDGRRAGARRAGDVAAFAAAVEEQRAARWLHHVAVNPGVAEAITAGSTLRADVWSRRLDHDDAFRVTLGWGTGGLGRRWSTGGGARVPPELAGIVAAAGRFDDAAVPADLGPGAALAVGGPGARAVVRSLVVQLATWVGPADWRVVVVADDPTRWDWCRWLPHAAAGRPMSSSADDLDAVAATLSSAARRRPPPRRGRHRPARPARPAHRPAAPVHRRRPVGRRARRPAARRGRAGDVPERSGDRVDRAGPMVARHGGRPRGRAGARRRRLGEPPPPAVARVLAGLHDPEDPSASTAALATVDRHRRAQRTARSRTDRRRRSPSPPPGATPVPTRRRPRRSG